jgi:hypothetical protein
MKLGTHRCIAMQARPLTPEQAAEVYDAVLKNLPPVKGQRAAVKTPTRTSPKPLVPSRPTTGG